LLADVAAPPVAVARPRLAWRRLTALLAVHRLPVPAVAGDWAVVVAVEWAEARRRPLTASRPQA